MLIRVGYEFIFDVPAPAPMLLLLDLVPDRDLSVRRPGGMRIEPAVYLDRFFDRFGNRCTRILAPAGPLRIWDDLIVADDGWPDQVGFGAEQVPIVQLPYELLIYLLGSRYCEVDRLTDIAWKLFGGVVGGWARVQAVCNWVHGNVQFGYQYARPTKTAYEVYEDRTGVCRDFTHLALTFCRCLGIPARYATGYLGDIGVPVSPEPDGLQRLVRGLPERPLVHGRRPPQHPADRPHGDGARPRRGRRRDDDLVRQVRAEDG